ncbi:hypothetical protein M3Y97_00341600 [Aphelenchoides bicaudatus]|nr:hypothetical protein M3Y97_00341600 [Aphelenchoides bicaudatus]
MQRCLLELLGLGLIVLCYANEKGFSDYNHQVYPDSLTDFGLCRLTEPSLVCDPNELLNPVNLKDGVILLHEATQHVLFNTECVCNSVTYGTCVHKTRGYPISVVILNKIRSNKKDDPAEVTEAFAKLLRRRLKRGQCDEDTLIVYSVSDAQLFTVVGSTAKRKLDLHLISEVENLARIKHLDNGNYTAGLQLMVEIFGQVFLGKPVNLELPPINENGLKSRTSKWSTWLIVLFVVGILAFVTLCILVFAGFFAFRRYYQRQARGYEPGHQRPRPEV